MNQENWVAAILIAFLMVTYLMEQILQRISSKNRRRLLILLFLTLPFWLSIAFWFLKLESFSLFNGQSNYLTDLAILIVVSLLLIFYSLIVLKPEKIAYILITTINKPDKNEVKTFWNLLDQISFKRRLTIITFSITTVFIILFNILNISFLLKQGSAQIVEPPQAASTTLQNTGSLPVLVSISFGIIFLLLFFYLALYRKVNLPETQHKRSNEVKETVKKLSIAAGIDPPKTVILSHPIPTSFSIKQNLKPLTIYITTCLLNLTTKEELEANIGHEIAHILSSQTEQNTLISNLVSISKVGSFGILFTNFILNPTSDPLIIFWGSVAIIHTLIIFKFLSIFIYYWFSFLEDIYADIKAVELTRNPKPLFNLLLKIKNYKVIGKTMPVKFYSLYFTGEKTVIKPIPMPQPPISLRLSILKKLDYTLNQLHQTNPSASKILCPLCKKPMEQIETKDHLGRQIQLDRCPTCGSVWFDQWELWYIANLSKVAFLPPSKKPPFSFFKPVCPHCGVKLFLLKDPNIPKDVNIWRCPSCKGNWLQQQELLDLIRSKKTGFKFLVC